jgi:hypothetical protein
MTLRQQLLDLLDVWSNEDFVAWLEQKQLEHEPDEFLAPDEEDLLRADRAGEPIPEGWEDKAAVVRQNRAGDWKLIRVYQTWIAARN